MGFFDFDFTNPFSKLPGMSGSDSGGGFSLPGMGGGSGGLPGMDMLGGIGGSGGGGVLEKLFGSKPIVPEFPDATKSAAQSITGNIANFDAALTLTGKVNQANQDQLETMLRKAIPGYDSIQAQISQNISEGLKGNLTPGTESYLQRKAAATSLAGGFSGSGAHRNLELRDLGLQSYTETQRAMDSATRWITQTKANAVPRAFDVSNMFISPMQQFEANKGLFERNMLENKIRAAPDPQARGAFDTSMQLLGMALGAYSGGPGYQGTYQQPADPRVGNPYATGSGSGGADWRNYTSGVPSNQGYDAPSQDYSGWA